jgi:heptosyltransferase III
MRSKPLYGKESKPKTIILLRPDRLGDVLISLPAFQSVRAFAPDALIYVGVRRQVREFVAASFPEFTWFDLETETPVADLLIAFHDEPSVSRRFWRTRRRIGPRRWFSSYLFWNLGTRVGSKHRFKHEAQRCMALLEPLGVQSNPTSVPFVQVEPPYALEKKWDVILHPGMGGSALNLLVEEWLELYKKLRDLRLRVTVSIGPQDLGLLHTFSENEVQLLMDAKGCMQAFKESRVVVAPSTGPLHVAAALGTSVYGIFSPIFAQRIERWGPLTQKRTLWQPDVRCPAVYRCHGFRCADYPCMRSFNMERAVEDILKLMRQ